jgi:hypothetical protein
MRRAIFVAAVLSVAPLGCDQIFGVHERSFDGGASDGAAPGDASDGAARGDASKIDASSSGRDATADVRGDGNPSQSSTSRSASTSNSVSSAASTAITASTTGTTSSTGSSSSTGVSCNSPCTKSDTRCAADAGLETCDEVDGGCLAWTTTPCGTHQECTSGSPGASCTCKEDPVCQGLNNYCVDTSSELETCSLDGQGCWYGLAPTPCTDGACVGNPGSVSCCTNACDAGAVGCGNGGTQLCEGQIGACSTWTAVALCATGLACERYDGPTCLDPQWDEWPIPNDPVDVDAGAPEPESYVDNGDGSVTDTVTGLVWQQAVPPGTYAQANAALYCKGLSLAGHADWRLPTAIELVSILDLTRATGTINSTYFPNTPTSTAFWSSTPLAGSSLDGWLVHYGTGHLVYGALSAPSFVRCVR